MVTTAARTATPGPSAAGLAAGRLIPQARPPGDRAAATSAWDTGGTGSGTAEEATEPMAAVGDPGREQPARSPGSGNWPAGACRRGRSRRCGRGEPTC